MDVKRNLAASFESNLEKIIHGTLSDHTTTSELADSDLTLERLQKTLERFENHDLVDDIDAYLRGGVELLDATRWLRQGSGVLVRDVSTMERIHNISPQIRVLLEPNVPENVAWVVEPTLFDEIWRLEQSK